MADELAEAMSSVERAMQEADEALRQSEAAMADPAMADPAVRTPKAPDEVEPGSGSESL